MLSIILYLLLAGICGLQIKTLLLTRQNEKILLSLQSKLFHMSSTVQTKRLKKKLIQQTAVRSTEAVEAVHTSIAGVTFDTIDALSTSETGKANTKALRDIHDISAKGIYRTAKEVNKHVGSFADLLFGAGKSKRSNSRPDDKPDD